jgi:hypothetical protein
LISADNLAREIRKRFSKRGKHRRGSELVRTHSTKIAKNGGYIHPLYNAITKYLRINALQGKEVYSASSFAGLRTWSQLQLSSGEGLIEAGITMARAHAQEVKTMWRDRKPERMGKWPGFFFSNSSHLGSNQGAMRTASVPSQGRAPNDLSTSHLAPPTKRRITSQPCHHED